LILGILLAFPILELFLVGRIAREAGWELTLAWLLIAAVSGVVLIRGQRRHLLRRMVGVLQGGHSLFGALFAGIRPLLAGLLLIFPGPVTDVLAILLLLVPAPAAPPPEQDRPADNGVIEGEWRREEVHTYSKTITLENTHGQETFVPGPEDQPDAGSRQTDRDSGPH
jgi:UPF0716 protein FxsA